MRILIATLLCLTFVGCKEDKPRIVVVGEPRPIIALPAKPAIQVPQISSPTPNEIVLVDAMVELAKDDDVVRNMVKVYNEEAKAYNDRVEKLNPTPGPIEDPPSTSSGRVPRIIQPDSSPPADESSLLEPRLLLRDW